MRTHSLPLTFGETCSSPDRDLQPFTTTTTKKTGQPKAGDFWFVAVPQTFKTLSTFKAIHNKAKPLALFRR